MNTYWISLPCDLLSSLASFQCSLLHHLHLSSDLGLSNYVNQHSHLNLSRNVRLPVLYDLDFNKREIAAYPSLKDERYFDGFKRSLLIVAKTHECSEVLDPNYTPGSAPEEQEPFEAKQTFMFSVFNANL